MDEQRIVEIAGRITHTANNVNDMSTVAVQAEVVQLQETIDELMQAGFETTSEDLSGLMLRLENTARRCLDCCLDRLLISN